MSERSEQEVLVGVARMIREVIGEDWANDVAIDMETSFSKDLELESIEFVALAEKLRGLFGEDVDFVRWLSSMELQQILALKVGELVQLIVRCSKEQGTA